MGLDANNPLVQIGITAVVCTIPALASTGYRLWVRRGRYWLDDAFALCSAIGSLLLCIGCFVHITGTSPHNVLVASYYLMAAPFYAVIWFARLSILFSIIRIDPSFYRRRALFGVGFIFFALFVIFVCQLFWVCEPHPSWKLEKNPQCSLTQQVVILQLVTDIGADIILTVIPLRLIRHLKDAKLRKRLTVIFATCIITSVVSLVHAAFIFTHAGPQEVIAAIVEDTVSLLVCNIPVVITNVIRIHESNKNTTMSKPTAVRFAAPPGDTTTGGGWQSTFRWQRELDSLGESERTTGSSVVSKLDIHSQPVEVELSDAKSRTHDDAYDTERSNKSVTSVVKMQDV